LGATVFNIPFEIIVLIIWLLLGKLVGFLVLRQIKAFNEIDIYLRTLLQVLIGQGIIITFFALFKTSFTSQLILLLPAIALLILGHKPLQTAGQNRTSVAELLRVWPFLLIIAGLVLVIQHGLHTQFTNILSTTPFEDPLMYATNAFALDNTGIENLYPDAGFFQVMGNNLYHYYDIWQAVLLSNLSGTTLSYYESIQFVVNANGMALLALALLAMANNHGRTMNFWTFIISGLLVFIPVVPSEWVLGHLLDVLDIDYSDYLKRWTIPNYSWLETKYQASGTWLIIAWIYIRRAATRSALGASMAMVVCNPVLLPALAGGMIGWFIYGITYRRNLKLFYRAGIAAAILIMIWQWPNWINAATGLYAESKIGSYWKVKGFSLGEAVPAILLVLIQAGLLYLPTLVLGFINNKEERWYSKKEFQIALFCTSGVVLFHSLSNTLEKQVFAAPAFFLAFVVLADYLMQPFKFMLKRHNWILLLPLIVSLGISGLLGYQSIATHLATAQQRKVNLKFYQDLNNDLEGNYELTNPLGVFIVPENQPIDIYFRIGKPLLVLGNSYIASPLSMPWLERIKVAIPEGNPLVRSQPYYRYASLQSDIEESERQLRFIKENNVQYVWVDSTLTEKLYHLEPFIQPGDKSVFTDTYTGHQLWLLNTDKIKAEIE
jgi:hypothetical protein